MNKLFFGSLGLITVLLSYHIRTLPALNYKPVPNTALNQSTILLPYAEVINDNGTTATLVTPRGDVYTISSMPAGRYRDVQIKDNTVTRAEPAVEEGCSLNIPSEFLPYYFDQSKCL